MVARAPDNQVSKLQPYSWGVAAENKPMSTNRLKVTPTEPFALSEGELKSKPEVLTAEGVKPDGTPYVAPVVADQAIDAMWLPLAEGNRLTAPDIRRGERILLWKFADLDRYFWTPAGLDNHLRRLETAIFAFSGVTDESQDATLPDNTYFLEVSTHQQTVTFQSSDKNGEFCRYVMQFNMKEGKFLLSDDIGNEIEIDSRGNRIEATNADKTLVKLERRSVLIKANDVTIDAKETKITGNLEVKGNVKIGGTLEIAGATKANGITSPKVITGPIGSV